jgi:uncharacterized protein
MRPKLLSEDFHGAVELMKATKVYAEEDRVMYWLNLGTIEHYAGRYQDSNANFFQAEGAMRELWTKSVSAEASKFLINEAIQSYGGEDFEKTLVYLFTSLNLVQQGKVSDALVEARRADEFLKELKTYYDKQSDIGTLYNQDAFMLWLVGLYYEIEGTYNDAFLAYRAAWQTYRDVYASSFGARVPKFLEEDLVRSALLLGDRRSADQFRQETGATGASTQNVADGEAELVIIFGLGESPFKEEFYIQAPMPDGYFLRIALPRFSQVPRQIHRIEVESGGRVTFGEVGEPVNAIAVRNFRHQLPAIQARAIARATAKYVANKGMEAGIRGDGKDSGRDTGATIASILGNIAAAASESADLRGWSLLPAEFQVVRMWLPAGQHRVNLRLMDKHGAPVQKGQTLELSLKHGERRLMSLRRFM